MIQDVMIQAPDGLTPYALHKHMYDVFAEPGKERQFLYSPVLVGRTTAVVLRGTFSDERVPPGMGRPIATARTGDVMKFTLRANPTVSKNGKRGQILMGEEKDSLRHRWLMNRAQEYGFNVQGNVAMHTQPWKVDRPQKPFRLNVTTYSGTLVVEDQDTFNAALCNGIGRSRAWGCGLLLANKIS